MSASGFVGGEWDGPDLLARGRAAGLLSAQDQQFARRLADLYGEADESTRWALAVACHQDANGHVCADLGRLARDGIVSESGEDVRTYPVLVTHDSVEAWCDAIASSGLVAREGELDAVEPRPLILDAEHRLYLARAYHAQSALASYLRAREEAPDFPSASDRADEIIARLAVSDDPAAAESIRVAMRRPLTVVTGGPGTGKTTLVVRLIAGLIEEALQSGSAPPRVRLLAPTGKAAAAMAGAFARGRGLLEVSEEVRAALPAHAETLQRALFGQTRLDAFGRRAELDLEADVVVVDETSMVDLDLMTRLFAACSNVQRVLLLGDPDQLASVDSGAVLREMACPAEGASAGESPLGRSLVRLTRSHRFAAGGGIGRLAAAIRDGDVEAALALLEDPTLPEVSRCDVRHPSEVVSRVVAESDAMHRSIVEAKDPLAKLDRLGRYRVLCAHRKGPLGVETLGERLDEAAALVHDTTARAGWWRGRLLLVTRNAPDQDLWNGDVGLIENTSSGLRALFPDGTGGVRALSAGRLPNHESAIALSVHKSQGSEFDVVDLVLGARPSPILTRELFYTGVTRARTTLRVHASEASIREIIGRQIHRDSGLADRLGKV